MNLDLLGALMVGLLGSTHCFGMCGGVSSALASATNKRGALALYNLGRLLSYGFFGAVVGGAIAGSLALSGWQQGLGVLRFVSGVFMVLIGLYVAGWYRGLAAIESLGQGLWKRIMPFATRLLPLRRVGYALPLGMLWGWIPCGLVYSMLSWSAASGSAANGAWIMLAFGLGTLPAMLTVGFFAQQATHLARSPVIRTIGGLMLILLGILSIANTVF